eukprot:CAMPEP_0170593652 /NCGR_PEP_ID=MMETSP0224-20130122/13570_1 /TAXON_ID=285029 /ORGANISM="Togula jolla, Strain CCCM 725" /LENGTH=190 /DNA_ID=CAMNT_0010917635 /DNA_START=37 /DNA_END=609 /DNA_ORIENTATION=-
MATVHSSRAAPLQACATDCQQMPPRPSTCHEDRADLHADAPELRAKRSTTKPAGPPPIGSHAGILIEDLADLPKDAAQLLPQAHDRHKDLCALHAEVTHPRMAPRRPHETRTSRPHRYLCRGTHFLEDQKSLHVDAAPLHAATRVNLEKLTAAAPPATEATSSPKDLADSLAAAAAQVQLPGRARRAHRR